MITVWSQGVADENMPEAILMEALEKVRKHPWWHARAKLALATLKKHGIRAPAPVADVGCGWGTNLNALEKAGYQTVGFDISRHILELIDHPRRHLVEADLNQALPKDHAMFDALLALDVIEHLDDDRGAIMRMASLLQPEGVAIISVPALPELFSEFDRIQGHRRRYLPETLHAAFQDTGLAVREIFWWGGWMVPVVRHMRNQSFKPKAQQKPAKTYVDYLRLPPWPVPIMMSWMYAFEQDRALKGRLETGTSLFAVAVRKN
jgi:2-polyprenyl-3-methyl-5-hydroxy-6-metoxy-1,4-benzoquinol methylase